jgi:hypothetical protein
MAPVMEGEGNGELVVGEERGGTMAMRLSSHAKEADGGRTTWRLASGGSDVRLVPR